MDKPKLAKSANQATIKAYDAFKIDIEKYHQNRLEEFEKSKAQKLEKIQDALYFKTLKKNTQLEQVLKTKQELESGYEIKLNALKIDFEDLKINQNLYNQKVKELKTKYEDGKIFEKQYKHQVQKINTRFEKIKQQLNQKHQDTEVDLKAYGKKFYECENELKNETLKDLENKKDLIVKLNQDNLIVSETKIKDYKAKIAETKNEWNDKLQAKEIGIHTYNKKVAGLEQKAATFEKKVRQKQANFKPLILNKQIINTKFNRFLNENSNRTFIPGVIKEIGNFIAKNKIIFIILVLLFYTSLMNRNFWSLDSLRITMKGSSEVLVMALAMTMVILTGGIDLSVGSLMAFSGILMLGFAENGMNMSLAILLGLIISTLIGFAQGLLIGYGRMVPFVVTLGGLLIFRGAAILYADSKPIIAVGASQKTLENLANSEFLGLNVQIWIVLIAFVLFALVLKFTVFGRQIYAVGSNRRAAFLSGVKDKQVETFVYTISGAMAGLAGMLIAARTQSMQPSQGQAWELKAIAATVIGGTALTGGRGGVIGTLVGWIILSMMPTLFTTLGYSSQIEKVATGLIIIIAVLFNNNLDFRSGIRGIKNRLKTLFKQYLKARR